jgi:uncharacterized protein
VASRADDREDLERQIGEAIVLARLGALLHDLCHIPFGHSIEDDLGILVAHDKNSERFDRLWALIGEHLRGISGTDYEPLLAGELYENLRPLILSKENEQPAHERIKYPFVADLVGDTICADLLDYLPRDHAYSGLPIALGHRFLSAFFVTPEDRARYRRRMALSIVRDGRERTDIISELLKHLRYRYELTERVLVHHAKLAADAMVGKALELWYAEERGSLPEAVQDSERDAVTRRHLEEEVVRHGDDGLLEYLQAYAGNGEPRRRAIRLLVDGLLERKLFKLAGRSSTQQGSAEALYRDFGRSDERRRLEAEAASYAGVSADEAWKIVLWLPPPNMRLKVAEVLVYDGAEVLRFVDYERSGQQRGSDIYEAHAKLWAVSLFVHDSLSRTQRERVLAYLGREMEVRWDGYEAKLGETTREWPFRLAAVDVARELKLTRKDEARLVDAALEERVARGAADDPTHAGLMDEYREVARRLELSEPDEQS